MSPRGSFALTASCRGVWKVSVLIAGSWAGGASAAECRSGARRTWEGRGRTCELLSALCEPREPAADARGPHWCGDLARQGADDPRVDGDPFTCGCCFDTRLQRLGQAKRDPGRGCVFRRRGRGLGPLLLDEDEVGVLPAQAHLD